jgi:hypothetical protein
MSSDGNAQEATGVSARQGWRGRGRPPHCSTQSRIDPPAPGRCDGCHAAAIWSSAPNRAAPPGSAMTTPHGHGRSRRRRRRAWRSPGGRGGSTSTTGTGSTTDCSRSTIGPVARFPIDVPDPSSAAARASPAHPHQASAAEAAFVQHAVSRQPTLQPLVEPASRCLGGSSGRRGAASGKRSNTSRRGSAPAMTVPGRTHPSDRDQQRPTRQTDPMPTTSGPGEGEAGKARPRSTLLRRPTA